VYPLGTGVGPIRPTSNGNASLAPAQYRGCSKTSGACTNYQNIEVILI
jgi:hypothetical protein